MKYLYSNDKRAPVWRCSSCTPSIPIHQSVDDIVLHKNRIRGRNRSNNSTYITKSSESVIQVFGKLYGANKYETALISLAIYQITSLQIELYEIEEGSLTKLPKRVRDYILTLDRFEIITANFTLERNEFDQNDSLRSPRYIYSLLEKLEEKKCALCNCEIPQIIHGAHIWPVADIKSEDQYTQDQKLEFAIDGDNGLWLCQNHHKLLDVNLLRLSEDGSVKLKEELNESASSFIQDVTINDQLPIEILTDGFVDYLRRRNENLREDLYTELT